VSEAHLWVGERWSYKTLGTVWSGLFVHPFSHTCNIGHVSYRLQFTTQLI